MNYIAFLCEVGTCRNYKTNLCIFSKITPHLLYSAVLIVLYVVCHSQGGFQIYVGVLTTPDLPLFNDDDIIIDELFIEVVSIAGSGESSLMAYGENGRVNFSLSAISVQCINGFSGDDCETVNMCNDQISCNQTLGYCASDGQCICFDGITECATVIENPDPTNDSTPALDPTNDSDPVPIIVGVVVTLVLLAAIAFVIVVVILFYSRNKRKKAGECSTVDCVVTVY